MSVGTKGECSPTLSGTSDRYLDGIPAPRMSVLQTNPILAAPVRCTDRRISAGFIVEAAAGALGLFLFSAIKRQQQMRY